MRSRSGCLHGTHFVTHRGYPGRDRGGDTPTIYPYRSQIPPRDPLKPPITRKTRDAIREPGANSGCLRNGPPRAWNDSGAHSSPSPRVLTGVGGEKRTRSHGLELNVGPVLIERERSWSPKESPSASRWHPRRPTPEPLQRKPRRRPVEAPRGPERTSMSAFRSGGPLL